MMAFRIVHFLSQVRLNVVAAVAVSLSSAGSFVWWSVTGRGDTDLASRLSRRLPKALVCLE